MEYSGSIQIDATLGSSIVQTIPITLSAAGMVLAREIMREDKPNGPPVCGKGLVLTDSLIERLRKMGIQSVTVEGQPVKQEGAETLESAIEALDRRFRKAGSDPLTRRLQEIYRKHIRISHGE